VAIIASLRGQAGLAVGNIIGSNISNILLILGGTSLVAPLPIVGELAQRDVWVMLGVAVLGVYFMASKRRMSRLEGAVCVALYVGYIGFIFAV
jgi:cation:H+ antiporter